MVEVFKTDVRKVSHAKKIIASLLHHFPCSKVNFDLQDCDKVLRVEGENFIVEKIIVIVRENGFQCSVLV